MHMVRRDGTVRIRTTNSTDKSVLELSHHTELQEVFALPEGVLVITFL